MSFFTIITATYNAATTLPRLLESLAAQTYRDFELIIQDGASTDDTVAVAESYRHRLPSLSLVSEPDTGIYDAWNKALPRVRGEWLLFLGGDDVLATPEVLHEAATCMKPLGQEVIFASGDVLVTGSDGFPTRLLEGLGEDAIDMLRAGNSAQHSGLFQRATMFLENTFDTSFRISGDHDLICRLWKSKKQGKRLGLVVTIMGMGGMTSRIDGVWRFRWEVVCVLYKHFGIRAALPCLKGLIKGVIPLALVALYGHEKAAIFHNRIRKCMGKTPAWDISAPQKKPRSRS